MRQRAQRLSLRQATVARKQHYMPRNGLLVPYKTITVVLEAVGLESEEWKAVSGSYRVHLYEYLSTDNRIESVLFITEFITPDADAARLGWVEG